MARNHRGKILVGEQTELPEGHQALMADKFDAAQEQSVASRAKEAAIEAGNLAMAALIRATVMEEPLYRR
jgi:hypothetical protein